jgi:hypothetical protein
MPPGEPIAMLATHWPGTTYSDRKKFVHREKAVLGGSEGRNSEIHTKEKGGFARYIR